LISFVVRQAHHERFFLARFRQNGSCFSLAENRRGELIQGNPTGQTTGCGDDPVSGKQRARDRSDLEKGRQADSTKWST
jgi:hypothetical protein